MTTEGLVGVSSDLAAAANFADVFAGITSRVNQVIIPYLKKPKENHILSILAARLIDHTNFVKSLIDSSGKGLKAASYRECAFGRWYENEYEKYKNIKEYVVIQELHKKFHEAADVFLQEVTLIKAKGVLDTSRRLLDAILKLSEVIC
ncbi:CZB domain-containing protein [Pelotomaculum isophthalicicum JI]|uniref:CZB domain-containing protein n=1 Tax=Pelotomaculum isophthalicicum JI TaxID=947010 RepID=A0A9X4H0D8_9FIRM|nr:CZB domain-containing protein [Pelotomaculum isophthalicicum JI]